LRVKADPTAPVAWILREFFRQTVGNDRNRSFLHPLEINSNSLKDQVMFRSVVVLVGGLAALSATLLFAQEAVLGQKYGNGVHAYFSGDFLKAHEQLTAAIKGGTKDPRPYYFRGLTYLKLGRPEEAVIDFKKGADLESLDSNKFYNVSRALERVQGSARMELETYRVDARMAALEEAEKVRKARYEAIQLEESRVLRDQALSAPPPELIETPEPAAEPAVEKDPFADSEEKPAAKTDKTDKKAVKPVKKAAKSTEEEPVEKPAGKAPAADDDPFNTKPDKAAKKAAPKKSDEKAEDDPFNPKTETPPAKPKSDEKKPDEKKPEAGKPDPNDPFTDETPNDTIPAKEFS
jgi:tetratricopeptide (TPR) repeat protein